MQGGGIVIVISDKDISCNVETKSIRIEHSRADGGSSLIEPKNDGFFSTHFEAITFKT